MATRDSPLLPNSTVQHEAGPPRSVSPFRTSVNLLKMYLGSGILGSTMHFLFIPLFSTKPRNDVCWLWSITLCILSSPIEYTRLPFAFQQSGLAAGLIIMVVLAFITTHSMVMLIEAKKGLLAQGKHVISFGDLGSATFGRAGRIAIDGLLAFTQLAFCCVYVVFIAQNTAALIGYVVDIDYRLVALMWLPILIGFSWIRSLHKVAPLSTFANVCVVVGMIFVAVAAMISLHRTVEAEGKPNIQPWANWENLPTTFGMAVYAYEGIGVIIPSETSITKPRLFPKILIVCLVVSSFQYVVFGCLVYLGFGVDTQEQILLNVAAFAGDNHVWIVSLMIITVLFILAVGSSYPLQFLIAVGILEEKIFDETIPDTRKRYWIKNGMRAGLACLSVAVAVSVPNFGLLIGLVGSLGCAALQYVFPAAIYLRTFWRELKFPSRALYIFYVVLGIFGGVAGSVRTVMQIVETYGKP